MTDKRVAILLALCGVFLITAAIAFFHIDDVRQWFPFIVLAAGLLVWKGYSKYRDA